MTETWFDRLVASIADRGRAWVKLPFGLAPLDEVRQLSRSLVSERGEASGAALAVALQERYLALDEADRQRYFIDLATSFAPPEQVLKAAAAAYATAPGPEAAMRLAEAAESPRQELLRRFNMAHGGTGTLVQMRAEVLRLLRRHPELKPLNADLRHLFVSWFNRGFLQIRRIDWNTPAAILEKLIAYEAVHEIQGWDDLRRRLAADRRCFAFFHPALEGEPLIFLEVAFTRGLAPAIEPLLAPSDAAVSPGAANIADTAVFYSISNCQQGLNGISFGNFLIKQVVSELQAELPNLRRFATLSPVPGFRKWLDKQLATSDEGGLRDQLARPDWHQDPTLAAELQIPLLRFCARYLCLPGRSGEDGNGSRDTVARFHLGNGARLEQINWLANTAPRGLTESWGIMVNYLYDLDRIEENHEAYIHRGVVATSAAVADLTSVDTENRRRRGRSVGKLLNFGIKRA